MFYISSRVCAVNNNDQFISTIEEENYGQCKLRGRAIEMIFCVWFLYVQFVFVFILHGIYFICLNKSKRVI